MTKTEYSWKYLQYKQEVAFLGMYLIILVLKGLHEPSDAIWTYRFNFIFLLLRDRKKPFTARSNFFFRGSESTKPRILSENEHSRKVSEVWCIIWCGPLS